MNKKPHLNSILAYGTAPLRKEPRKREKKKVPATSREGRRREGKKKKEEDQVNFDLPATSRTTPREKEEEDQVSFDLPGREEEELHGPAAQTPGTPRGRPDDFKTPSSPPQRSQQRSQGQPLDHGRIISNVFKYLWDSGPDQREEQRREEQDSRATRAAKRREALDRWDNQATQRPPLQPRNQPADPAPAVPPRPSTPQPPQEPAAEQQADREDADVAHSDGDGPAEGEEEAHRDRDQPRTPDRERDNPQQRQQPAREQPPGDGQGAGPPPPPDDPEDAMAAAQERTTNPLRFALRTAAERFDITSQRDRWTLWLQQWEVFTITSGLENLVTTTDGAEDEAKGRAKRRCMMAALKQAFTIDTLETMNSLGLDDDQLQDHQAIIDAMTIHINGTGAPWVKRQELLSRKRQEGEVFDDYLASLRYTAGKCQLDAKTRDLLVTMAVIMNVREPQVTEKLLRMPDGTTLEEVATKARAIMASKTDQNTITKGVRPTASRIQVVDRAPPAPRGPKKRCGKCARTHQPGSTCPADGKRCIRCDAIGHFSARCPTRRPAQPGQGATPAAAATQAHPTRPNYDTDDALDPYGHPPVSNSASAGRQPRGPVANSATAATRANRPTQRGGRGPPRGGRPGPRRGADPPPLAPFEPLPLVPIHLTGAGGPIDFLPDTGANFSVMSLRDYRAAGLDPTRIDPRTEMARDPELADGQTGGMNIVGVVRTKATAEHGGAVRIDLYIADKARQPLLSRQATLELEVLPPPKHR